MQSFKKKAAPKDSFSNYFNLGQKIINAEINF